MMAQLKCKQRSITAVLVAAMTAAAMSGCEPAPSADEAIDAGALDGSSATQNGARHDDSLVFSDNVHELSEATEDRLEVESNRLLIAGKHAAELAHVRPGDIVISDRGDGFWRHVLAVSRAGEMWVFATRPAELTEVVERGEITFEVQQGESGGHALRSQPLNSGSILNEQHVGGVNLDADLSGDARANVTANGLTINMADGRLGFRPALKFQMRIDNNTIVYETLRLSGYAELTASWQLSASASTSYQRSFDISPSNRSTSFRLAGKRYQIEPTIRLKYDAVANNAGDLRAGLTGDGYLLAGYECTPSGCAALDANGQDQFDADPTYDWLSGEPRINFRARLHAGVELSAAATDVASVYPLSLGFDSHTIVAVPYCPYEQKASVTGIASTEQHRLSGNPIALFDEEGIVADLPGCSIGSDDDQEACVADADCIDGEVCTPLNVCGEDKPFYIALKWGHELDLDLYVETEQGAILSKFNRQINGGELALVSAGPSDIPGRCTGNVSLNCENQAPQNGQCPTLCNFVPGLPASSIDHSCVGVYAADCSDYSGIACPTDWGCSKLNGRCVGSYAASCIDLGLDETECGNKAGCQWSSGYCSGTASLSCDDPNGAGLDDDDFPYLQPQRVCDAYLASHHRINCQSFGQTSCESTQSLGCEWNDVPQHSASQGTPDRCDGGSYTCSDLGESTCGALTGCTWQDPQVTSPPSIEYAVFDELESGEVYKIWVVNPNGAPEDIGSGLQNGRIPYTLLVDARDREAFQMHGEIETDVSARSVFFLYEVPAPSTIEDPSGCRAESDGQLCAQQGADCGRVSNVTDSCGNEREIYCGSCPTRRCHQYDPHDGSCPYGCTYAYDEVTGPDGSTLHNNKRCEGPDEPIACQNNTCECSDETEADLCNIYGYDCGTVTVTDGCGSQRTIDCGGCSGLATCSPDNVCCESPSEQDICADYEVTGPDADGNTVTTDFACGSAIQITDRCGRLREVDCSFNDCSSLNGTFETQSAYKVCTGTSSGSWTSTLETRRDLADRVYSCGNSGTFCDYEPVNKRHETLSSESCADDNYTGEWSACEYTSPCDEEGTQWRWEGTYGCVDGSSIDARCQLVRTEKVFRDCSRSSNGNACGGSCGSWSTCSLDPYGACVKTRTCTGSYTCDNGSCDTDGPRGTRTESQSCAPAECTN